MGFFMMQTLYFLFPIGKILILKHFWFRNFTYGIVDLCCFLVDFGVKSRLLGYSPASDYFLFKLPLLSPYRLRMI